jgi:hypothetical protein
VSRRTSWTLFLGLFRGGRFAFEARSAERKARKTGTSWGSQALGLSKRIRRPEGIFQVVLAGRSRVTPADQMPGKDPDASWDRRVTIYFVAETETNQLTPTTMTTHRSVSQLVAPPAESRPSCRAEPPPLPARASDRTRRATWPRPDRRGHALRRRSRQYQSRRRRRACEAVVRSGAFKMTTPAGLPLRL